MIDAIKTLITTFICVYLINTVVNADLGFFGYHPILAVMGVIGFGCNGINLMASPVYRFHFLHMVIQFMAGVFLCCSVYVIYSLKEEYGKPHWFQVSEFKNITWHAFIGGIAVSFWCLQVLTTAFTMPPGIDKKVITYRGQNHMQFGQLNLILALLAIGLGWLEKFGRETESLFVLLCLFGLLITVRGKKLKRWDQVLLPKPIKTTTTTTSTTTTSSSKTPVKQESEDF